MLHVKWWTLQTWHILLPKLKACTCCKFYSVAPAQGMHLLQVLLRLPQLCHLPPAPYLYLVKFIQLRKKSNFATRIWYYETERFPSLGNLKIRLRDTFSNDLLATSPFQLWYLDLPTNAKLWLVKQRSLQETYQSLPAVARITFWCERSALASSELGSKVPPQKRECKRLEK